MRVLNLATKTKRPPSELLGIEDKYLAFLFDEACMFIIKKVEDSKGKEQPKFFLDDETGESKPKQTHFKSFSEYYKQAGFENVRMEK